MLHQDLLEFDAEVKASNIRDGGWPMTDMASAKRPEGSSPRPNEPSPWRSLRYRRSHLRDERLDRPRLETSSRGRPVCKPAAVRGPRAIGVLMLGLLCLASGCQPPTKVDAQVPYDRGNALYDRGKLDEAIAQFRLAIQLEPGFADAHYELGSALGTQGKWEEAIPEFREAIRLKPDDDEVHYNLGHALLQRGDLDAAVNEFLTTIRLKPDDVYAHVDLGIALGRQKRHGEAVAAYRQALRLAPQEVKAHANLGVALVRLGKHQEAVDAFRTAIRLQPGNPEVHYNLGNLLDRMRKTEEAIGEYRTAIGLSPDYAAAHHGLGCSLLDRRKLTEALAEFRESVRLGPDDANSHNSLGIVLRRLGHREEAIGASREAVRLGPEHGEAHNGLAFALLLGSPASRREIDEALVHARRAVELSKTASAYNGLALAEYRAGHPAEALAACERSMAMSDGNTAYTWFPLALAQQLRGEKDSARGWFDKAAAWTQANDPANLDLRQLWAEAAEQLGLPDPTAAGSASPAPAPTRGPRRSPRPSPDPQAYDSA
jgi:tetratricopeptide (TPR) repeat protein